MKDRKQTIQEWIDRRKEDKEITECAFYITVPKFIDDLYENDVIKKIWDMLNRNKVTYERVDTVPGAWNLNKEWIETGHMDCIVEYCGAYPIHWNMDDIIEFERMEKEGEIVVQVHCISKIRFSFDQSDINKATDILDDNGVPYDCDADYDAFMREGIIVGGYKAVNEPGECDFDIETEVKKAKAAWDAAGIQYKTLSEYSV